MAEVRKITSQARAASKTSPKRVHLALQGGGAHGAFTWGVLDALLQDERIAFEGISGTSAGALNAVALAHGWARGLEQGTDPAEEARVALAHVWRRVMGWGAVSDVPARMARLMLGALPAAWSHWSPYQSNPLDYNPLRKLVAEAIDFERVARLQEPKVFVTATEVETGRAEVFSGARLTADAVLASCCLPQLYQAPVIDGKAYWDGGYAANPALAPLIEMDGSADVLLVQINPLRRRGTPTTTGEIADRVGDLTFNASLIAQMRTVALVNEMIAKGVARPDLRPIRVHRIDGGGKLGDFPVLSKARPEPIMLEKLFELGNGAARRWLKRHLAAVGEKSTVDIARDYGDPLQLDFGTPEPGAEDDDNSGSAAETTSTEQRGGMVRKARKP